MTNKFANPPPPTKKPPVCKAPPGVPPPPITPIGLLLQEYDVASGPPGPTFNLSGILTLRPVSPVRWATLQWPSTSTGAVAEFIYNFTLDEWTTLLKYWISGVWQFDLFTYSTPNPGHKPFSTGPFDYLSGQINGDLTGIIFRT